MKQSTIKYKNGFGLLLAMVVITIPLAESSLTVQLLQKPVFLALSAVTGALLGCWRIGARSRRVFLTWLLGILIILTTVGLALGRSTLLHLLAFSLLLASVTTIVIHFSGLFSAHTIRQVADDQ